MKIRKETVIDVSEWDKLVEKTYGKPYSFQQQDGCKERGNFYLKVPSVANDYNRDTVPEIVNHSEMGVSFKSWLARNPKQSIDDDEHGWKTRMWWERNFYPDIQMIANDLNSNGLLDAGEYTINIDW